jgi:hypothetical protein
MHELLALLAVDLPGHQRAQQPRQQSVLTLAGAGGDCYRERYHGASAGGTPARPCVEGKELEPLPERPAEVVLSSRSLDEPCTAAYLPTCPLIGES